MRKKIFIIGFLVLLLLSPFIIKAVKTLPIFWQYFFNKEIELKKQDSHFNILLLGVGGGSHEGPNLSDTIIFASINPEKNKVSLVSIPRDLWVPDLNAKVNTAYATGEAKKKGGGLTLAKATIAKVVGQPVDYAVRIDFAGFIKAVDLIGGLDINVERVLDDYAYPVEGKENDSCGHTDEEIESFTATVSAETELSEFFSCRYKHLHFDKGLTHMDGKTALEFVRSRHAVGDEGTDFARSVRQEKVIKAFKDKILSAGTLLNPAKVIGLYNILEKSIDTDIKQEEFDDFIKLADRMKSADIKSTVLDYGDSSAGRAGLLVNPPISEDYRYTWVLIPRIGNGDFSEINKYVECELSIGNCSVSSTASTPQR